jgi:hypothetical protein
MEPLVLSILAVGAALAVLTDPGSLETALMLLGWGRR